MPCHEYICFWNVLSPIHNNCQEVLSSRHLLWREYYFSDITIFMPPLLFLQSVPCTCEWFLNLFLKLSSNSWQMAFLEQWWRCLRVICMSTDFTLSRICVNLKLLQVSLVNDGPVTMQVDSPSLQTSAQSRWFSYVKLINCVHTMLDRISCLCEFNWSMYLSSSWLVMVMLVCVRDGEAAVPSETR
jgi:hypothetical protein